MLQRLLVSFVLLAANTAAAQDAIYTATPLPPPPALESLIQDVRLAFEGQRSTQSKLAEVFRARGADTSGYWGATDWLLRTEVRSPGQQFVYCALKYNGWSVPQDRPAAWRICLDAAAYGDVSAMTLLAKMYREGTGVEASNEEAQRWLSKAAEGGYAMAQTVLAQVVAASDGAQAKALLESAAAQGSAAASTELGLLLANGAPGLSADPAKAIEPWQQAASQGSDKAEYLLARAFFEGKGVEQDPARGFEWLRKAAEHENAAAQYEVAQIYATGTGVEKDAEAAAEWMKRAASQSHAPALEALGGFYEQGLGVGANYGKALNFYRQAAEAQVVSAQYRLGVLLANPPENQATLYPEAAKWLRAAADAGEPRALERLAQLYYEGQGVPQSDSEALALWSKAAQTGLASAQFAVGRMYRDGRGTSQDLDRARGQFELAAGGGDSNAMIELALFAERDLQKKPRPKESDYAAGLALVQKAADSGNVNGQFHLGRYHLEGKGTKQDPFRALEFFLRAAEQGHAPAMRTLGLMHAMGSGVPRDYAKAQEWYRKAVAKSDARSAYLLGQMYKDGDGVKSDKVEYWNWTQKSAEWGDAQAQYLLGMRALKGDGIAKDRAAAVSWLRKAARQAHEEAKEEMEDLKEPL